MGSTSAFSACPQIELSRFKFPSHSFTCQFISSRKNYDQLPVKFQIAQRPTFLRLFYSFTKIFHSPIRNPTFSKLYDIRPSFPFRSNLSQFFVEKFVGLLIGSFIFMGFFKVRYVIALPVQTSNISPTFDRNNDTQGEEIEKEMIEKILDDEPRNIDILKSVLYGKMRSGETKEAIKYAQNLINLEPNEVEWRLLLALCHDTMGQLDKAKRLFMEILEERPLFVRALHGLALVLHKNHEDQSVFEMLNKSLDIARQEEKVTEQRNIGILIAQMHVLKGELEESLKKLQDLVDENPLDFRPYLFQGIIYSLLDKKKEAAEQFETYWALVPDEFPQREFIDDIVLAAKTASREQLQKEFDTEFSYKKRS